MKRYISRVFSLLVAAVLLFASDSYGQCGTYANGEATIEPPAGFQMPGFQPNTLSPLTGAKSYRSNGFVSDAIYKIVTPVHELPVTNYNVLTFNFQFALNTSFFKSSPTTTPDPQNSGTYNIYVRLVDLTHNVTIQLDHITGALMPAIPKTSKAYTGPNQLATCVDGSCNTKVKYYFEIEAISTNFHTSTSNWIKFDEISSFNSMCNLSSGGVAGVSLSVQGSEQSGSNVVADINLFKDSESVGATTEHSVVLYAFKKLISTDALIEVINTGNITVPVSSGTSNTLLQDYLVNDGTYYYEYYVGLAESYVAANNVFPKIEQSQSSGMSVTSNIYEAVNLTDGTTNETHYVDGNNTISLPLVESGQYTLDFPDANAQSIVITFKDANGVVLSTVSIDSAEVPVSFTIPTSTASLQIDYQ